MFLSRFHNEYRNERKLKGLQDTSCSRGKVEFLIRRDLKKEINKPWFKNEMNDLGKELDLPEGMNWEEFWVKWFLSEDPSAYIKVDRSE